MVNEKKPAISLRIEEAAETQVTHIMIICVGLDAGPNSDYDIRLLSDINALPDSCLPIHSAAATRLIF
jgi:hypothetical protein